MGHLSCVKFLISHGASLTHTRRRGRIFSFLHPQKSGVESVGEVAKRAQQIVVAEYITKCIEDSERMNTTRAHLEECMYSAGIHSSPQHYIFSPHV